MQRRNSLQNRTIHGSTSPDSLSIRLWPIYIQYSSHQIFLYPKYVFFFFATRKKMPTKVFYSGFAISLFQYLFCICFVKNSYDINIAIVFNMFDSEIATTNMCNIHITTILLTATMCILHILICSIQKSQLLLIY